jgi:hypothetical protein
VTAPATRTPVAATVAAVRTTLATASPDGCGGGGSAGWRRAPVAPRCDGAPAPAAARPGFGDAAGFAFRDAAGFARARGFDARGAFAAGFPPASALVAALRAAFEGLPAESRFSLRLPGREWGRFPSTPSSSVMAGDSSPARSGYMEAITRADTVGKGINWLTG